MKVTKELSDTLFQSISEMPKDSSGFSPDFAVRLYANVLRLILRPFGSKFLSQKQMIPLINTVMLWREQEGLDAKPRETFEDEFYSQIGQLLEGSTVEESN